VIAVAVAAVLLGGCAPADSGVGGSSGSNAPMRSTRAETAVRPTGAETTTVVRPPAGSPTTAPTPPAPTAPGGSTVRDSHILYSGVPRGQSTHQIFRMRADGTDPVQLTSDPTSEHNWPRPSPDGSKILFYKAVPGSTVTDIDTNNLWVMDADGSNERLLLADGAHGWTRQGHVEWSPDGTRLIMSAGGSSTTDLYVTDPEGGDPTKVTDRSYHMAIDPSWAPDGRSALFIGCPRGSYTCWWWEYEVHRIDLTTGVEERLTVDSFADFDPYMSPDGTQIVWLRCTGSFPFGPWGIFRASAGSAPMQPTAVVDDGNINSSVYFSDDGSTMLFSRHVIGVTTWQSAAVVGTDGSGLGFVGGAPAASGQGTPVYWP